jgi:2-polyprenyl-6-methoxyphenol hydroxylase-like FAD-dependent oxidoreductase
VEESRVIGSALIVGGGVGGMCAAIALRRIGVTVELIDADATWRVYGAGISVTGISLRAFDDLGLLDEVRRRGFVGCGMRGRSPGGAILFESPRPDNPQPIQQSGGILRPVLHDILSGAVRRAGVQVTLGVTVAAMEQDSAGVAVTFADGRTARYDLLVGADGIHSQIRGMIFPDLAPPQFTGQGCWRVVARRPREMDRTEMYLGGPVKLGLNPVSEDEMYMFVLEHVPDNPFFADEALVPHLTDLIEPFAGAVAAVRESIRQPAQVNYRPLEWILVPDSWYRGRIVLIGDAAHATTPHLASGAGLAAEDGIVLAQELQRHDSIAAALQAFMQRRFERVRRVVENSVRIGEIEMAGDTSNQAAMMLGATLAGLQAPY